MALIHYNSFAPLHTLTKEAVAKVEQMIAAKQWSSEHEGTLFTVGDADARGWRIVCIEALDDGTA